jgi:hypothetical protein
MINAREPIKARASVMSPTTASSRLMAGTAAETLLHADDPPWEPKSDLLQAQSLASLVCSSPGAVDALLTFGFEEAMALIREHKVLVLAVARALIDHPERTLTGAEVDTIIAKTIADEALTAKRLRRERWQQVVANTAAFEKQFKE